MQVTTSGKRQDILAAALELITEHGFHGTPVAAIAKRAGVGAGTIYRYFATKDILITELFDELHNKIFTQLQEGYEVEKPIKERFIYLCTALLRYFITHPQEFRYLEQYLKSPYGVAHRQNQILGKVGERAPFRLLFEEGVTQQVMKDLPRAVLFALAFGSLLEVARAHIFGFVSLDALLLVQTVEACWDALYQPSINTLGSGRNKPLPSIFIKGHLT